MARLKEPRLTYAGLAGAFAIDALIKRQAVVTADTRCFRLGLAAGNHIALRDGNAETRPATVGAPGDRVVGTLWWQRLATHFTNAATWV